LDNLSIEAFKQTHLYLLNIRCLKERTWKKVKISSVYSKKKEDVFEK